MFQDSQAHDILFFSSLFAFYNLPFVYHHNMSYYRMWNFIRSWLMLMCMITLNFPGIEDMTRKRSELQQLLDEQEDEKITLQREVEKMSFRLAQINASLSQMTAARNEYDQTVAETESAYAKVSVYTIIFSQILDFIRHD
jgi:hypothetical protein